MSLSAPEPTRTNGTTAAGGPSIAVFILAKDEANNISRCLDAVVKHGWDVFVLDSGSTDNTPLIAQGYAQVSVVTYSYTDHCTAYNDVTTRLGVGYRVVVILDADMVVSDALQHEVNASLDEAGVMWDALQAPIAMWVDGVRLRSGSLCPPKPFAFATGNALFARTGHAERLIETVRVRRVRSALIHDDRKDYSSFLESQARYASKLIERYRTGQVSSRDRLRVHTPLLVLAVPFVSFVLKRGFMAGRVGLLYALDRMIAELVMYRYGVETRVANRKASGQHARRIPHD